MTYFKRKDKGFCPAFHAPDGVVYWVQDHKIYGFNGGEYEYSLMQRKESECINNYSEAKWKRLLENHKIRYKGEYCGNQICEDKAKVYCYSSNNKELKVIYPEYEIKSGFRSFCECLNYAEKYIEYKYGNEE